MSPETLNSGVELILALQRISLSWLPEVMNFFSSLGNEDFYFMVGPLVYWCIDSRLGLRLSLFLTTNVWLNSVLKIAFHDPRPYWYDVRVRLLGSAETGFGLPSGHSQLAVVVWGTLAAGLRRSWGWAAAVFIIFAIGLSRMYLGVHFPTDVYYGWLTGIVVLLIYFLLERPVVSWYSAQRRPVQVGITFLASLLMVVSGTLISNAIRAGFTIPREWVETVALVSPDHPIAPFSLNGIVTAGATFFGFVVGAVFFMERGWLNAGGPWLSRGLRFVVGLVGVLFFWRGLSLVFSLIAEEGALFGYILRYVRYSLVGMWISGGAPWLFVRFGLADLEQPASE